MLVLGLDLETSGLNSETDEIIEIAAVVWDTHRQKPLKIYNEFVIPDRPIPPEITEITGITNEEVLKWGVSAQEVLLNVESLCRQCEYIVAHNGREFDQCFIHRYLDTFSDIQINLPWIDTMTDLPYPEQIKTRKLTYLAAEHHFLNPFSHRALFDVLSMMKVFSLYPIHDVIALAKAPMVRVVAQVSFNEREKAKSMGFHWDPARKEWFIGLKESQIKSQIYPFPITWEHL